MKHILLTCFILTFSLYFFGQTISTDVIVSAGGEFKNTNAQISWTLGDFQTATFSENSVVLTQGFLQSNLTITGILDMEESQDIKIKVFPNPVKDILNIEIQSSENSVIQWELINQTGKIIKAGNNSQNLSHSQIRFSSYNYGVYFIRTFKKDGSYMKVFKVVYVK